MADSLSRQLAHRVASAGYSELARPRLHDVKRLLLDYCGVAVSGSRVETGRIAREFALESGEAQQATVIGSLHRVSAMQAAFANAVAEHSIEMDDVDDLALFHYGPPIVSAALAVAEWRGASGSELLVAIAAGCDVMNRLSLAVNPALRDRGFHTTPVCGAFAAAAAAGRLMGLSVDGMVWAFGLAGAQSSGLMEMYGPSMQKRVNPGPAARNGIAAASLARLGFTGTETILEGERGFGAAFAGGIDSGPLLADLAGAPDFDIEYKPYSAARPIHSAVDAALRLRRTAAIDPSRIEKIVVHRHPDWARFHANVAPRNYHEAQVSLPYSVAVALVDGSALPADYSDENVGRADLVELTQRVSIEVDRTLPRGVSSRVELVLVDGGRVEQQVDDPTGSRANPMTDDDLAAKFRTLVEPVLGAARASALRECIWGIDQADDIGQLASLLRFDDGASDHAH